jgi:hypothetical protein
MILTYQIYQLNCTVYKDNFEGFEGSAQNVASGIDDTNAINTLAQIAKNLMAGGVTIPGNMTIQGGLNGGGAIRGNFAEDQENGLKFPYHVWMKTARTDGGQDPYKMLFQNDGKTVFRSHAGYEFRNPKDQQLAAIDGNGILYVQGRNILAELDQCIKNGQVIYNQRTADGRFVWGDGVGSPDSGWSRWIIRKA